MRGRSFLIIEKCSNLLYLYPTGKDEFERIVFFLIKLCFRKMKLTMKAEALFVALQCIATTRTQSRVKHG